MIDKIQQHFGFTQMPFGRDLLLPGARDADEGGAEGADVGMF